MCLVCYRGQVKGTDGKYVNSARVVISTEASPVLDHHDPGFSGGHWLCSAFLSTCNVLLQVIQAPSEVIYLLQMEGSWENHSVSIKSLDKSSMRLHLYDNKGL